MKTITKELDHWGLIINSLRPSDAFMRQYNLATLVQIMACRLLGAKPSSEPMLPYCQLDHNETYFSEIIFKIQNFSFKEMHLKMSSAKWQALCLGLNGEDSLPSTDLICVSTFYHQLLVLLMVPVGSGNGMLPVQCQTISWINLDL